MSWVNYDEVIGTLQAEGFDLSTIDIGRMVRVKRPGHDQKGWYVVHEITLEDNSRALIGSYGYWSGAEPFSAKISAGKGRALSADQKAAIEARYKAEKKRAEAERARIAQDAAAVASRAWAKYLPSGTSDYLERKGVGAYGVRYSPSGNGTIAIPMQDSTGRVWGLQIIRGKNRGKKLEKQYWPAGLEKKAKFHLIGTPRDILLLAEGYATAATLHEATGLPVAVAFDAGNLMPVATDLHKTYRKARILICADDDFTTPGNPGCKAAEAAALAVGGAWVKPEFPADRGEKKLTDFNDLAHFPQGGTNLVRVQIEQAIATAGWSALPAPVLRGEAHNGGAGERSRLPSMLQIEEALERFSLVYGGGGTLFDHAEHMLVPKSDVLDILPEHGWRDMRARKNVVRLSEVGFDPAVTDPNIVCNLWGGWPTQPKAGKCEVLLSLLEYLCTQENNHREIYQWVLKWLAFPIQHPGAKMRTALVFHGPQGAGKNLFFEAVMQIYGEYGRIVDQSAIEDKFNDWASRKLFLIADEVVARAELFHVKNKLKGFVTGEWIRINPKNVAAHDERNHVNLTFLSNETQPLVLEKDDRRYAVIWTPDKLPPDFYQQVRDEINAGGIAALHQYFLDLDLGDFDEHTKPPMTDAKRDLIDVSMGSVERFVAEWKSGDAGLPFCPAASSDVYAAYVRWCKAEGVLRPRENQQFIGTLAKLPGWEKDHKSTYSDLHFTGKLVRRRMILPSIDDLSQAAAAGRKDYRKPDSVNQSHWLTECWLDFSNAVNYTAHGVHT